MAGSNMCLLRDVISVHGEKGDNVVSHAFICEAVCNEDDRRKQKVCLKKVQNGVLRMGFEPVNLTHRCQIP